MTETNLSESFDNPEYKKIFREIIKEDLKKFDSNDPNLDKDLHFMAKCCDNYFPDDLERQADLAMCVCESITRAEELGYPKGVVPKELANRLAKEYNVKGVFALELIELQFDKTKTFILGEET